MNGPFQVAQASGTGNSNSGASPRIFKLTKPLGEQAVVVNLGYDQKVQVDFSAIANEKITLVHLGEKLIILFDNKSTVTVDPFFDSRHENNLTVEVAPGRDVSVSEFASLFPITTDQSVLPAAGDAGGNGNAQASGANFSSPAIDPLGVGNPLPLLGPEVLPNFAVTNPTAAVLPATATATSTTPAAGPTIVAGIGVPLVVEESYIPFTNVASPFGSQQPQPPTGSNVDAKDFAASFTVNAPAGVKSVTYALTIDNTDTNLTDSVTGQQVKLVQNGAGEVDGVVTIQAVQTEVFTLKVDATGHVTMTELRGVIEGSGEPGDVSESAKANLWVPVWLR